MNTKTLKTSTLTGPALDWAVAKCLWIGKVSPFNLTIIRGGVYRTPVTPYANGGWFRLNWEVCGPIIEREGIRIRPCYNGGERNTGVDAWHADIDFQNKVLTLGKFTEYAPTALIAAMRCYVASKMGDTVDIPEELVS